MKKQSRIFVVFLSILLLFSVAACKSTQKESEKETDQKESIEDAKKIFQNAVDKTNALDSIDMDYNMEINLAQKEETLDIKISMNTKAIDIHSDALQHSAKALTSISGQKPASSSIYYKDGYYYIELSGQKFKYALDAAEMVKQIKTTSNVSISADNLKTLEAKKDGENILLTFDTEPSLMNDYVKNILHPMEGIIDSTGLTINKISGTYLITPEGYCKKTDIHLVMSMNMENSSIDMDMLLSTDIHSTGSDVTITFPEALDSYQEIEPPETTIQ